MAQTKFNAGNLDRKITIQQPVRVKNNLGGFDDTYTTFKITDANKNDSPLHNKEELLSKSQLVAEAYTEWTIRYDANVNAKLRILYEGLIYEIVGQPRETERRHWTVLLTQLKDNV